MKKYQVALAGNPNVGKSTVFNALTGMKQHTGNWTGKTVATAMGEFNFRDHQYALYDLPGTYSLMSHSKEEEVARDFICFEQNNFVVVVCDAVCLERNLNLVFQILEITPNVLLCVNLMDEAKKKHIHVNLSLLSDMLGVPVVGITARNKKTLNNLYQTMHQYAETLPCQAKYQIRYDDVVEETVLALQDIIHIDNEHLKRWIALKLLDGDFDLIDTLLKKYQIDEKRYFHLKDELIENGYDTNRIQEMYGRKYVEESEKIAQQVVHFEKEDHFKKERKLDHLFTSKITGIPIMILFLLLIFWITIEGANYPSEFLFSLFQKGETFLEQLLSTWHFPIWLNELLTSGVYRVVTWVVAVMLPPMAIFFPLFTILEDYGYLPRIAFNLDCCFKKCKTCGKQALTMMMGFGCNAVGVTGCRIIDSKRERLLAVLTNALVPCNGRFPTIIALLTMFFVGFSATNSFFTALLLTLVILISVLMTFAVSRLLSKTLLKGMPSSFVLELPPYRRPQFLKVITRSIFDRTLFVLGRAVTVAIPAGFIIWFLANIHIQDLSLLQMLASCFDPLGKIMGLDGVIIVAFILGFPANEIVFPLMLMAYQKVGAIQEFNNLVEVKNLLLQNGWTVVTAMNFIVFSLFHFPCSTTLMTIYKETKSKRWTLLAFILPTLLGIICCITIHLISLLFI